MGSTNAARLQAISDLHVAHAENRRLVEALAPGHDDDWLIVAGDIGESIEDIEWSLDLLSERFATVLWVPGNHDLWTLPDEPAPLRGEARYAHIVALCRRLGVLTPEDPFPTWEHRGEPLTVAPLFLLYDYSYGRNVAPTKAEALARAQREGIVCMDEYLLHPEPFATREDWCRARVAQTEQRLAEVPADHRTVLVNHFPLHPHPTEVLHFPVFAQWCGTMATADWHRRFRASVVVYGHLHIPRTTWRDGTRFEEVSLGYPREWQRRRSPPPLAYDVLAGAAVTA